MKHTVHNEGQAFQNENNHQYGDKTSFMRPQVVENPKEKANHDEGNVPHEGNNKLEEQEDEKNAEQNLHKENLLYFIMYILYHKMAEK